MGSSCKVLLFFILSSHLLFSFVNSTEFLVGGDDGWVTPKSKDDAQMYNDWASKNRFKVNDAVHFKYKKDSVMVVSEEEYKKCRSSHPLFYSNNGDTLFKLDRPGSFFFISGVSGHCDRGQKMIIKVLEPENPPHPPTDRPRNKNGAAVQTSAITSSAIISLLLLLINPYLLLL